MDILGTEIVALLDSGAGVSVMSNLNLIEAHGFTILKSNVKVCTADDTQHTCLGYINVPYTLGNETRVVPTLVVPQIKKSLILGMDFWKAFQIRPMIASKNKIVDLELTWTSNMTENPEINLLMMVKDSSIVEEEVISLSLCLVGPLENPEEIIMKSHPEEDDSLDVPTLNLNQNPEETIDSIETEHTLTEEEARKFKESLRQFPCTSEQNLRRTSLIEHEIE